MTERLNRTELSGAFATWPLASRETVLHTEQYLTRNAFGYLDRGICICFSNFASKT